VGGFLGLLSAMCDCQIEIAKTTRTALADVAQR